MSENDVEQNESQTNEEVDPGLALATTPYYNQPEDADRYPVAIPSPLPAHTVFKGDPQIDGPYLDDVRQAEDEARRDATSRIAEIQKQRAEEGQKLREDLQKAADILNPEVSAESESASADVPETDPNETPEENPQENSNPDGSVNDPTGGTPSGTQV